ncbi:MAG: hypothetical protein AB1733_18980 [Thermodesulfobacteriota bacterium]
MRSQMLPQARISRRLDPIVLFARLLAEIALVFNRRTRYGLADASKSQEK